MDKIIKIVNFRNNLVESQLQEDRVIEIIPENINENPIRKGSFTVPIDKLAILGTGVSSLIPALRTVTVKNTVNLKGLYTVANSDVNAVLQTARDGTFWPSLKLADKTRKLAKLKPADDLTSISTMTAAINPATMMMVVALYSIEQKLDSIEKMQKELLSFLEKDKTSEIEGDAQTLFSLLQKYKFNWDNERFLQSSHKMVLDLQRSARKNIIFYQKSISESIKLGQFFTVNAQIKKTLNNFIKSFQYYRFSLYTFSLASLLEIMLGGDFKEEYIQSEKDEIEAMAMSYRKLFSKVSVYLENMGERAVKSNLLKGLGSACKAAGKFIGAVPKVKEGNIDEFLYTHSEKLKLMGLCMEQDTLKIFARMNDPGIAVFTEKMEDMALIFNHTSKLCFDEKNIYLSTA